MAKIVTLSISDNQGYSADQVVDRAITLGELLEALQEAIRDHGEDARVVTVNGQQYGAQYGIIADAVGIFQTEDEDDLDH